LKQQAGIKTVASSVDTSAVQPTGPTQVSVTTAGQPTLQFSFDQTAATLNGMLNVSDLSVANGFTVGGDSNFGGLSSFQKLATFFAKAVFKQDVQFQGHITVANDSAGYAHIRKTESEVHVTFAKPYDKDPIVAATPANGAFASYSVKNIAKDGFDIVVPTSSDQDLLFSWTANGIVAPVTSENPKNEAVTTTP
jgi:hypothetical protein